MKIIAIFLLWFLGKRNPKDTPQQKHQLTDRKISTRHYLLWPGFHGPVLNFPNKDRPTRMVHGFLFLTFSSSDGKVGPGIAQKNPWAIRASDKSVTKRAVCHEKPDSWEFPGISVLSLLDIFYILNCRDLYFWRYWILYFLIKMLNQIPKVTNVSNFSWN